MEAAGYSWRVPSTAQASDCVHVWLGGETAALQALQLVLCDSQWLVCSTTEESPGLEGSRAGVASAVAGLSPTMRTLVRRR